MRKKIAVFQLRSEGTGRALNKAGPAATGPTLHRQHLRGQVIGLWPVECQQSAAAQQPSAAFGYLGSRRPSCSRPMQEHWLVMQPAHACASMRRQRVNA